MLVAQTLPTGATFFINYIILCMLAYPVELLRIFPIAYTFIHKRFITTPRQYHDLNFYTSYLNYGILYPLHVLLFVVVICYSIIAPLIIIPGSIYFGLGWLIFKNQLMFVYVKEFESYGRHWIMAFDRCVVGCVVFQLTLAGILASKNCEIQALAVLPLLPITYYYWRYCHLSFRLKTELVPLDQLPPPSFYARRAELEAQEAAQVAAEEERRNKGKKAVVAGSSVVNKASDLGDVVGSAEEHLLERYPTR